MLDQKQLFNRRLQRKKRVAAKVVGTSQRPRLAVFRSNQHLSLQVIDDSKGVVLATANDFKHSGTKTEKGVKTAEALAKTLKLKKIKNLVLDRSYYKYHGRIKAAADALRAAGINL